MNILDVMREDMNKCTKNMKNQWYKMKKKVQDMKVERESINKNGSEIVGT